MGEEKKCKTCGGRGEVEDWTSPKSCNTFPCPDCPPQPEAAEFRLPCPDPEGCKHFIEEIRLGDQLAAAQKAMKDMDDVITAKDNIITGQNKAIERLHDALCKHGEHEAGACPEWSHVGAGCTCGLSAAIYQKGDHEQV
jgi:hypothetical protein